MKKRVTVRSLLDKYGSQTIHHTITKLAYLLGLKRFKNSELKYKKWVSIKVFIETFSLKHPVHIFICDSSR